MTTAYAANTGDQVLCTAEDGGASNRKSQVLFLSYEEAEKARNKPFDNGYGIVAVSVIEHDICSARDKWTTAAVRRRSPNSFIRW
jgi:hypothetical protein